MTIETEFGYKIPELEDKDFWDSYNFNISRYDAHSHDGVDSVFVPPQAVLDQNVETGTSYPAGLDGEMRYKVVLGEVQLYVYSTGLSDWKRVDQETANAVVAQALLDPSVESGVSYPGGLPGELRYKLASGVVQLFIYSPDLVDWEQISTFDDISPMTTGGDLIYGGASGAGTRLANGTAGQVLTSAGTTLAPAWQTLPVGDVVGPAGSTVNALARFNSTSGRLLKNGTVTQDDSGNLAAVGTLNTHTIQGGTGTLALTSDITGTNTGTNTGDQDFDDTNPMTTGGDVIYGGASGAGTRLANGTAGQVLTSAGTTLAPTWETPVDITVVEVKDIWEWDLDDLTSFALVSTTNLRLVCSSSQAGTETDFTTNNHQECDYIGYFWEFIENFNRGVGIQIIDDSAVVWDILPVAGAVGIWLINDISLNGRSGVSDVDADIDINIDSGSAKIEIYKDGVLQSDFTGFDDTFADRAAIDTANPNGFRAVIRSTPETNFSYNGYVLKPLVRRRYRGMSGLRSKGGWVKNTNNLFKFTVRWTEGVMYTINYNWVISISGNPFLGIYNSSTTQDRSTLIDLFSIMNGTNWNNSGDAGNIFTETAFHRTVQYVARDGGSGLSSMTIEIVGTNAQLAHNNDANFNSYTDLSEMADRPLGANSYITVEG